MKLSPFVIAERLSARLLILQSIFLVGKVWPQLPSHLGIQLKVWLVCKNLSHLGMPLKEKVVHTYVSLLP